MQLQINWTDDCQGKKDYDGNLVAVSTRYWPGTLTVFNTAEAEKGLHGIAGGNPSATCTIRLSDGYPYQNGETTDLISATFEEKTFEEVAKKVEDWAQKQADRVYQAVTKEFKLS